METNAQGFNTREVDRRLMDLEKKSDAMPRFMQTQVNHCFKAIWNMKEEILGEPDEHGQYKAFAKRNMGDTEMRSKAARMVAANQPEVKKAKKQTELRKRKYQQAFEEDMKMAEAEEDKLEQPEAKRQRTGEVGGGDSGASDGEAKAEAEGKKTQRRSVARGLVSARTTPKRLLGSAKGTPGRISVRSAADSLKTFKKRIEANSNKQKLLLVD